MMITNDFNYMSAQDVKPMLIGNGEIAFLDVREHGQYGEGHPFFAVNLPYSRLEIDAVRLLPHHGVRVIVLDAADGVAEKAVARLHALGYHDVALIRGGTAAWAAAGFTLFKGVNVLSKAFGEQVEHQFATPSITAEELLDLQVKGGHFVLLDGRTPTEFRKMNIPGARSCPNAELVHRLPQLVSDTSTPIIVNCAGRTRSIIGAQSLRNLALPNPVLALRNGTQGWRLAGFELQHGTPPLPLPPLDKAAAAVSQAFAEALIARFDLPRINQGTLTDWQQDDSRTLYLFDVRTREEFEAGHLHGFSHAPGGQLVQATDQWVAVRGARIVLADDTGARAANTALWLRSMGYDASILEVNPENGAGIAHRFTKQPSIAPVLAVTEPAQVAEKQAAGAIIVDLSPSMQYRKTHIEGAVWSIRPRLQQVLPANPREILLATPDHYLAELAAIDLVELGCQSISWIRGGPAEWRAGGLTLSTSPAIPADDDCIDYLFFVHDRHEGNLAAARAYLEWETRLLQQMDEQEKSIFHLPLA